MAYCEKRGRQKYKKLEYLKNEKSFLDQTFYIVFEGLSFNEKQKFDKK